MSMQITAGPAEDSLGPLLDALAQSLDVREVFAQISTLARQTIAHDGLLFGLITADGERYRILASSELDSAVSSELPTAREEWRQGLRESPLSALSR